MFLTNINNFICGKYIKVSDRLKEDPNLANKDYKENRFDRITCYFNRIEEDGINIGGSFCGVGKVDMEVIRSYVDQQGECDCRGEEITLT